jgi:hypothetical protein
MTIINDDSRVITKLETSLTDDARVVIYNRHMFIVQATGLKSLNDFNLRPLKLASNGTAHLCVIFI